MTLIELMVSMFLLALVGTMVTGGVTSALKMTRNTASGVEGQAQLNDAIGRIARDVAAADPILGTTVANGWARNTPAADEVWTQAVANNKCVRTRYYIDASASPTVLKSDTQSYPTADCPDPRVPDTTTPTATKTVVRDLKTTDDAGAAVALFTFYDKNNTALALPVARPDVPKIARVQFNVGSNVLGRAGGLRLVASAALRSEDETSISDTTGVAPACPVVSVTPTTSPAYAAPVISWPYTTNTTGYKLARGATQINSQPANSGTPNYSYTDTAYLGGPATTYTLTVQGAGGSRTCPAVNAPAAPAPAAPTSVSFSVTPATVPPTPGTITEYRHDTYLNETQYGTYQNEAQYNSYQNEQQYNSYTTEQQYTTYRTETQYNVGTYEEQWLNQWYSYHYRQTYFNDWTLSNTQCGNSPSAPSDTSNTHYRLVSTTTQCQTTPSIKYRYRQETSSLVTNDPIWLLAGETCTTNGTSGSNYTCTNMGDSRINNNGGTYWSSTGSDGQGPDAKTGSTRVMYYGTTYWGTSKASPNDQATATTRTVSTGSTYWATGKAQAIDQATGATRTVATGGSYWATGKAQAIDQPTGATRTSATGGSYWSATGKAQAIDQPTGATRTTPTGATYWSSTGKAQAIDQPTGSTRSTLISSTWDSNACACPTRTVAGGPWNITPWPGGVTQPSVTVSWAAVPGATGYQIYRTPLVDDTFTVMAGGATAAPGGFTTGTSLTLAPGFDQAFEYYVVATNTYQQSVPSVKVNTLTHPATVGNLTGGKTCAASASMALTWTAGGATSDGYGIFRRVTGAPNWDFVTSVAGGGTLSYTDTVATGTSYDYYVAPYNTGPRGAGTATYYGLPSNSVTLACP